MDSLLPPLSGMTMLECCVCLCDCACMCMCILYEHAQHMYLRRYIGICMHVIMVYVCMCDCFVYQFSPYPIPSQHRFHGHGVLHFTNGGTFEADWENGVAVGQGTGVRRLLVLGCILLYCIATSDMMAPHRLWECI